jgi:hypothetical protein
MSVIYLDKATMDFLVPDGDAVTPGIRMNWRLYIFIEHWIDQILGRKKGFRLAEAGRLVKPLQH